MLDGFACYHLYGYWLKIQKPLFALCLGTIRLQAPPAVDVLQQLEGAHRHNELLCSYWARQIHIPNICVTLTGDIFSVKVPCVFIALGIVALYLAAKATMSSMATFLVSPSSKVPTNSWVGTLKLKPVS